MKRRYFGINLDEGIPLINRSDFDLLHVDCFGGSYKKITSWLEHSDSPLAVGGQIGSGKTTLIRKAIMDAGLEPDIAFHIDQRIDNQFSGDFWAIVLNGFIELAINRGIDLSFSKLPYELADLPPYDWHGLSHALFPERYDLKSYQKKQDIRNKISESTAITQLVRDILLDIGKRLEAGLKRPLFLYAAGIDKFDPGTAGFAGIKDEVLPFLFSFKTLCEVNAVHLLASGRTGFSNIEEKIILPVISDRSCIVEILAKRMGVYRQNIMEELAILAEFSGGNPRQAIRLLNGFEEARNKATAKERLDFAIRSCTSDFFSYVEDKPKYELMKTIDRDQRINAGLLASPFDHEKAQLAVYGNWVLIGEPLADTSWRASINPLVKKVFDKPKFIQEPEYQLLQKYAQSVDMSKIGLAIQRTDSIERVKNGDQLYWEFLDAAIEEPIRTNLGEVFSIIQGALLTTERAGRYLIIYKDKDVADASRSYLFGKANSYEFQRPVHFQLAAEKGDSRPLIERMDEMIFSNDDIDIYSFEISGEWDAVQLDILDKRRDKFLDLEMIWWIPEENIKYYLRHWVQLRQMFRIFSLEDELLASLTRSEIESDLAFYEDLVERADSAEANFVKYLQIVLEYLKKSGKDGAHG